MKIFFAILLLTGMSLNSTSQTFIKYVDDEDVMSLSLKNAKVSRLRKSNKINYLQLPDFTSDSLYWERNIGFMIPKSGPQTLVYTRAIGPAIDTLINFFDSATRIRIKEGFIWIFRIYSPTAISISARIDSITLNRDQYICMYSNYIDSVGVLPYNYDLQYRQAPSRRDLEKSEDSEFNIVNFGSRFRDRNIYIEVFSPEKSLENVDLRIIKLGHGWPYEYRLSDAPEWIRRRYPDIDFERNCIKSKATE